jgi:hypothetical protein
VLTWFKEVSEQGLLDIYFLTLSMFSDTGVLKDIDTGQPEKGGAIVDIFQCTYVPFLCLQNGEHLDQLKSALTPV